MGNLSSCLTDSAYGKVGINIGVGVDVARITAPPAGRYKIWGMCRHALDDGLRLKIGNTVKVTFSGPGLTQMVIDPPLVFVLNGSEDVVLETNVATGLTGLASGTIIIQRQCEHLSEHGC